MTRGDASVLMLQALRKSAGATNVSYGTTEFEPLTVASQLRRDLGDDQLRQAVVLFKGECPDGCSDPVHCARITATAVVNWINFQQKTQKRRKRQAWLEATN